MFELENFAFSWWKIDWCPLFVIVLLLWLRKIMAAGFWFLYTIIAFHFTKLYIPKKITAFLLRSVYALSYFMWKNWKLEWNRLMVKTSTWTCLGWSLKPYQGCFICNSPRHSDSKSPISFTNSKMVKLQKNISSML